MAWKVDLGGGRVFSTDDLELDELDAIAAAAGTGWWFLNPLRRVEDAKALLAFYLVREAGMAPDDARAEVGRLKGGQAGRVFALLPEEESDMPSWFENGIPKAAGGPSTTSSAGSPSATPGAPPTS